MRIHSVAGAVTILAAFAIAPAGVTAQGPVTGSLKGLHDITVGNISATAEKVPANLYGYQPTDEVRTMGQILAHVANSQYQFCSAASGRESPMRDNLEETATTKAQITVALTDAFAFCNEVYAAMSDADGAKMVDFFGNQMAASAVLAFNSAHNYEHYGNLVTYMRINGIVPPSSAGGN